MSQSRPTVLLFETDERMAYLLERYAQLGNCRLIVAPPEVHVLGTIQTLEPQVIVIGLTPGDSWGWQVLITIRSSASARRLPLIGLCDSLHTLAEKAHDLDHCLLKPVAFDDFSQAVAWFIRPRGAAPAP